MKMDYSTVVRVEQGYLDVEAQVTILPDNTCRIDWWDVETKLQHNDDCPDKLRQLFFDLAFDNQREDGYP